MAQMILTAAGSAAFGPIGGFAGSILGGAIDRALFGPGDTRTDAPPLESLTVSVSADGHPIPDGFYVHPRIGRLIWSAEKKENRTSETTSAGKDFGGPEHTTTTINPTVTCAYSFGFGPGRPLWIKANKKMLADFRPTSEAVYANGIKVNVYDGTQTQPSYLAESIFPAAPGYMGEIIVEFEDLPILQFGNDPPQVIESMVVMDGSSATSDTDLSVDPDNADLLGYQYFDEQRGYLWMSWEDMNTAPRYNVFGCLDVGTRTWVYQERVPALVDGEFLGGIRKLIKANNDGTIEEFIVINTDNRIFIYDADSASLLSTHVRTSGGSIYTAATTSGLLTEENSAGGGGSAISYWSIYTQTDHAQSATAPTGYDVLNSGQCDLEESVLYVLNKTANNTLATAQFYPDTGTGSWGIVTDQAQYDSGVTWLPNGEGVYAPSTNTYFVPGTINYTAGSEVVIWEFSASGLLIETIQIYGLGYTPNVWGIGQGGNLLLYQTNRDELYWKYGNDLWRYSLVTRDISSVYVGVVGGWGHYDAGTDTVFTGALTGMPGCGVVATKLNGVGSSKGSIADAVDELCRRSGIPASNIDVTGITGDMWGCPVLPGASIRTTIEAMLLKGNGFGVMASDKVAFREFGGATDRVLAIEQLSARELPSDRNPSIEDMIPQNIDIPAIMDLAYVDVNAEAETTISRSAYHYEVRTRPVRKETPVVLDSAEAAIFINRLHQTTTEKRTYEGIRLLPSNLDLEPGDIIEITAVDKDIKRMLITELKISPTMGIEISGITERLADSTAYGTGAFTDVATLVPGTGTPQLLVLDTSLLRDVDDKNHLGPYVAAFRTGSSIPSTIVYGSASGETYTSLAVLGQGADVAIVNTQMTTVATIDAWDDQVITVNFVSGTAPSSLTETDVLAGGNACLIGRAGRWEIIQPATWTLVSGSTYTFTHTLRGRRGTDPYVDTHQISDYLIVLKTETVRRLQLSVSLLGAIYSLKAVGTGSTIAEVGEKVVALSGAPMKPYTVVDIGIGKAAGTHTWTWTARTRIGGVYGGANGLVDGYVGAQTDGTNFEIDIWNTNQTILYATHTVATESFVYTETMRTGDGLTASQEYVARIYHMNGTIRGHGVIGNSLGNDYDEIALGLGPVLGYLMDETTGTTADNVTGDAALDGTYTGTYTLAEPPIIQLTTYSVGFTAGYINVPDAIRTELYQVPGVTMLLAVDIDSIAGAGNQILMGFATGSSYSLELYVNNDTDTIQGRARSNTVYSPTAISAPITAGLHHIAMTVDVPNDIMVLYIDGVAETTLDPAGLTYLTDFRGLDGGAPSGGRQHQIFGDYSGGGPFIGHGQGPYVYAKALTAEEIGALAAYVID